MLLLSRPANAAASAAAPRRGHCGAAAAAAQRCCVCLAPLAQASRLQAHASRTSSCTFNSACAAPRCKPTTPRLRAHSSGSSGSNDGSSDGSSMRADGDGSGSLRRIVFGGGDGSFARQQNNNNNAANASTNNSSWALMGRVVQAGQLSLGSSPRQRLVLIAAAQHAGVSEAEMASRLQSLITLLPDLSSLLVSLSPATLAQLTQDTAGLADKLVQLRLWFPSADVAAMVSRRPTLLLDEHWAHVDSARLRLLARLQPATPADASASTGSSSTTATPAVDGNEQAESPQPQQQQQSSTPAPAPVAAPPAPPLQTSPLLDGLVSRQPLLLVANVDQLLDELARLLPAVDVMLALQRDPDLVTSVMCNRRLSIW